MSTRPRRLALASALSLAVVGLAFIPGLGLLLLPGFAVSQALGESHSVAFVDIGVAFSWFLYAFVAFCVLEVSADGHVKN